MAKRTFSQIIQYKGQLDISSILNSLNQVQQAIQGSSYGKANKNLFTQYTKDLEKLNKLVIAANASIQRGFKTPTEINQFQTQISGIEASLSHLQGILNSFNTDAISYEANEAQKQLQELEKSLQTLSKQAQNKLQTFFTNQKLPEKVAKGLANSLNLSALSGKSFEEAQKEINASYQKSVTSINEEIKKIQENIKVKQELIKNNTKLIEQNSQLGNFTASFGEKNQSAGSRRLVTTQGTKIYTNKLSPEQQKQLDQSFTTSILSNLGDPKSGLKQFNELLNRMGFQSVSIKTYTEEWNKALQNIDTSKLVEVQGYLANIRELNQQITTGQKELNSKTRERDRAAALRDNVKTAISNNSVQASYNNIVNKQENINKRKEQSNVSGNILRDNERVLSQITGEIEQQRILNRGNTQELIRQGQQITKLDSSFGLLTSYLQYTFSLLNIFRTISQQIRQTATDLQNLDKAFASIAMVTSYSVEDMWSSYDAYSSMANELGQSTKDVIASSALFFQQGMCKNNLYYKKGPKILEIFC